jgi:hypothetical protein
MRRVNKKSWKASVLKDNSRCSIKTFFLIGIVLLLIEMSFISSVASTSPTIKIADVYTEWDDFMGFLIKIDAVGCNSDITCKKDQNGGVSAKLSIDWNAQLDRPVLLGRYVIFVTAVKRLDTGRSVINFHSWILRGAYFYNVSHPFLVPMPIFFHVNEGTDTVPLEITLQVNGFPNVGLMSKCASNVLVHIVS